VYCPGCSVATAAAAAAAVWSGTELHYALNSSEIYGLRESALPIQQGTAVAIFSVVLYGRQT
jgi:hypothetical protein